MARVVPILTVLAAIIALWYGAAVKMNSQWALDQAARAGGTLSRAELIQDTLSQDRPKLPAPHQVAAELWETTAEKKITSKRSLVFHGWITLSATLVGFGIGTLAGILLAVGIVHNRAMDLGVMPWAIASQTIPILAIAPMIIVVLNAVGLSGLIPKALISTYLSFFPVAVGMVKGLRSPSAMDLDLMRTWGASAGQVFWRLRWPSSIPYLFASLKIAVAASLVGAIVGELPTGATQGLGARMLIGSQFGEPMIMWTALFAASILAAGLIWAVGLIEAGLRRRLGGVA